jgi:hypothetical protein
MESKNYFYQSIVYILYYKRKKSKKRNEKEEKQFEPEKRNPRNGDGKVKYLG